MPDLVNADALVLSVELASLSTLLLVPLCTPLAWWLVRTRSWWRHPIGALVLLPLMLPSTVIGFYLLVALKPDGALGRAFAILDYDPLPFTFRSLLIASLVSSRPVGVQPLRRTFEAIGTGPLEAATALRSSPIETFIFVVLPISGDGFRRAVLLGFAHAASQFGALLMIGGSIPGETRVASVALYDLADGLQFGPAHALAAWLLGLSFALALLLDRLDTRGLAR